MITLPLYYAFFLFLLWFGIYHDSLFNMVSVWTESKTYEHAMLILPISLWLAWRKKDELSKASFALSYLPVLFMILPVFIWMLGKAADIAFFEHFALVLSFQLLLWFALGSSKTKIIFFPIFYLIFCIPFGQELIPYLQIITADITVFLVKLSTIPIYRDGLFLYIPNGAFEVAEACSGIRFLISSIALGFLFAFLNFTLWWKRILFVIFSCIFPIIANGIRAYGIVLIGHFSNIQHATGADHLIYGWVFFSFVLLGIFLVANKFADPNEKKFSIAKPTTFTKKNFNTKTYHSLTLCLFFIFLIQLIWTQRLSFIDNQPLTPLRIPNYLVKNKQSDWGVSFPNAEQSILTKTLDNEAEVYIAASKSSELDKEFISYNNALFDTKTWALLSANKEKIKNNTIVNKKKITNQLGEYRYIISWYCLNNYCSASKNEIKILKAFYKIAKQKTTLRFLAVLTKSFTEKEIELTSKLYSEKII